MHSLSECIPITKALQGQCVDYVMRTLDIYPGTCAFTVGPVQHRGTLQNTRAIWWTSLLFLITLRTCCKISMKVHDHKYCNEDTEPWVDKILLPILRLQKLTC